ncbi:helix-turn-helix transcriptional regulator [Bifidobacterium tissieri]|uniref:helix-turn-helix transcriptional regulator n=1 Tax=Bifidobacterium tissieri TaxID=1630162 RepID=UPI00123C3D00|nr:helix-turn-helix transcriptional regulator [Bifidobacterium tissieri]KAA8829326.1 XRE family transcriptional regulator [Bifidobacterium tissieri]
MSLRDLRLKRGLTQQELGDKVGLSQGRIADYETGRFQVGNMTLDVALRICKALRVSNPKRLLEESDSLKEKTTGPGDS